MATIDPAKHYGKQGNSLPPDVQAEVVRRAVAGESRNSIAAALGIGPGAVSGIAARAGHTFRGAEQTRAALTARRAVLAERRAELIDRLYDQVEANLTRLEAATFDTVIKAGGGAEQSVTLPFVPTVDERNLSDVIHKHLTSLARLEIVDSRDDADPASNLLAELGRQLGIVTPDA